MSYEIRYNADGTQVQAADGSPGVFDVKNNRTVSETQPAYLRDVANGMMVMDVPYEAPDTRISLASAIQRHWHAAFNMHLDSQLASIGVDDQAWRSAIGIIALDSSSGDRRSRIIALHEWRQATAAEYGRRKAVLLASYTEGDLIDPVALDLDYSERWDADANGGQGAMVDNSLPNVGDVWAIMAAV